jgi:hypothetical protein
VGNAFDSENGAIIVKTTESSMMTRSPAKKHGLEENMKILPVKTA